MPEGNDNTQQTGAKPTAPSTTPVSVTAPAQPAPSGNAEPKGDEPLGDGGKKALEAEREARKELERQIQSLKEGLAGVFGGKPDGKATTDDLVASLSEQVTSMQRDATVYRLAADNGITDKDDIDLLRSAKDEDAMTRLASRLAAKAEHPAGPGTPKPDLTQGGQGTPPALNSSALEDALKAKLGIA